MVAVFIPIQRPRLLSPEEFTTEGAREIDVFEQITTDKARGNGSVICQ
jgi:hypothetical protein